MADLKLWLGLTPRMTPCSVSSCAITRYDPERHERRHVVVAAFDSRREFDACLQAVPEEIERRKAAGEQVDAHEHVSGTVHDPGSGRRAANGRLVIRALRRGVAPGPWMNELEMPSNIAVFGPSTEPVHQPQRGLGQLIRRWLARRRHHHRPTRTRHKPSGTLMVP